MIVYLLAFGWGIVILLSWIGWGAALNRILFPENSAGWSQRAAWGLALSVVVGGVLNLVTAISRTTILIYLGLGIAAWAIVALVLPPRGARGTFPQGWDVRRHNSAIIVAGVVLVMSMSFLRYAASVSIARTDDPTGPAGLNRFYPVDDFQAYFVFPEKMIQTGTMGRDPFSDRRLETSLGGQYFLDTFILADFPLQHVRMLDSGLGFLLVLGLLWGYCKDRGVSLGWSLSLSIFFLLLGQVGPEQGGWANITSLYTGMALFLSLCCTLGWEALSTSSLLSKTLIIALLVSGICSLKSSFIPACGVMLGCSYLCYLVGRGFKRAIVMEIAGIALFAVAFTLPWMISLRSSSGTLLYPLLGRGYHQSVYGNALSPYSGLSIYRGIKLFSYYLLNAPVLALGSLAIFYLMSRQRKLYGREPALSLLAGAVFGQVVLTLATQGVNPTRLAYPFLVAAGLVLMAECSASQPEVPWKKWGASAPLVAGAIAVFLIGWSWNATWILYHESLRTIRQGLEHVNLISNEEALEYENLQRSVPPGEVILTKLEKPFLLDFKRNTVFIVDWVEASPPPGMPFYKGSETLAHYLTSQSIRYVAHSYSEKFVERYPEGMMKAFPPWWATIIMQTHDFMDNLAELSKTRKRIYDDGRNFVLDLQQPTTSEAALETIHGTEGMSTAIGLRSQSAARDRRASRLRVPDVQIQASRRPARIARKRQRLRPSFAL